MTEFINNATTPSSQPSVQMTNISSRERLPNWETISSTTTISMGAASLVTNALVLLVLFRRQIRLEYSKFRWQLILITTTQILFCIFSVGFDIGLLLPPLITYRYESLKFNVLLSFFVASHAARNWAVAAVTTARVESIAWPLRSQDQRLFSTIQRTVCAILIVCFWCTFLLLRELFTVSRVLMILDLIFIRCFPVVIAFMGLILISKKLLCENHLPPQTTCAQNTLTVTKTVVLLALSFTVFEGISSALHFCHEFVSADFFLLYFGGCFQLLNSFSNIFAFIFASKSFRNETKAIFKPEPSSYERTSMAPV